MHSVYDSSAGPCPPLNKIKGICTIYQQTKKIAKTGECYTPACIFEALGEKFDLDIADPPEGQRHFPTIAAENFVSKDTLNEI